MYVNCRGVRGIFGGGGGKSLLLIFSLRVFMLFPGRNLNFGRPPKLVVSKSHKRKKVICSFPF